MTEASRPFYDRLSDVYDVMFPLASQKDRMHFLVELFRSSQAHRLLDAGCGTGRQAISLAEAGFEVWGADNSEVMLRLARRNAEEAGVRVQWRASDFASLHHSCEPPYDAVFCIGNSLPHVSGAGELASSLRGMVLALAPRGLLVLHLRNYSHVLRSRERLMPTLSGVLGEREYVFQRFVDFLPDGRLSFNILTLTRTEGKWHSQLDSTLQYPAVLPEIVRELNSLEIADIVALGGFSFASPYREEGENLIVVASRGGAIPATLLG